MKNVILFLIFCCFWSLTQAQESDGYYISKSSDTIRGKIKIPLKPKIKVGASSQILSDPLKDEGLNESNKIDYDKMTFDIRFAEGGDKFKKIDRLKVKGFGFVYEGKNYDFETWDVKANKQIYAMSPFDDVASNGAYFILKSINGAYPVYSLFQEVEMSKSTPLGTRQPSVGPAYNKTGDGYAPKRDIIFKHPSKGYIYISDQAPLIMKMPELLKFLELEEAFIKTLNSKESVLSIVLKYNKWKSSQ